MAKNQKQVPQKTDAPNVVFRTSGLFDETAASKGRESPGLGQKIIDFYKSKTADKLAPFGSSDKPFKGYGHFAGLRHAHLTPDLSLVYAIHSSNPTIIDLYGVFSHDDLGTGQPANMNRQKSAAKKFGNLSFK